MFEAYGGRDYPAASDAAHADIEIHPAMTGWLEGTVYSGPLQHLGEALEAVGLSE